MILTRKEAQALLDGMPPSDFEWDAGDGVYEDFERVLKAYIAQARELEAVRGALEAVNGAMLMGGDGDVGDYGWSITKLNRARPLIRAALNNPKGESHD